jgi:hypothetical protein
MATTAKDDEQVDWRTPTTDLGNRSILGEGERKKNDLPELYVSSVHT